MIGQKNLIKLINEIEPFPRFIILTGARGSGKKLLAGEIAKRLKAITVTSDIKIDSIREIINCAYQVSAPVVYLIADVDRMSTQAKNVLLTVTEEPPERAYFVVTVENINTILPTLKSRAIIFNMGEYSADEKCQYIEQKHSNLALREVDIVKEVCDTFYEIDLIVEYGVDEFVDYCELVVDKVDNINLANAFKIGQKLKFKEDDKTGYDLQLFFKTVLKLYRQELRKSFKKDIANRIMITCKHMSELNIVGVNKSAVIDAWIMAMQGK